MTQNTSPHIYDPMLGKRILFMTKIVQMFIGLASCPGVYNQTLSYARMPWSIIKIAAMHQDEFHVLLQNTSWGAYQDGAH